MCEADCTPPPPHSHTFITISAFFLSQFLLGNFKLTKLFSRYVTTPVSKFSEAKRRMVFVTSKKKIFFSKFSRSNLLINLLARMVISRLRNKQGSLYYTADISTYSVGYITQVPGTRCTHQDQFKIVYVKVINRILHVKGKNHDSGLKKTDLNLLPTSVGGKAVLPETGVKKLTDQNYKR